MRTIKLQLTDKQHLALSYLRDNETTDLLFGGGAGGGKTSLGCGWSILNAFEMPGSRGVIGRKQLSDVKQSTLLTLFDTAKRMGLQVGKDLTWHEQQAMIGFPQTGSTIYLKELDWIPSDPEYDRLGSFEYTYGFIDEVQQVREKAKTVLSTRLRYKIDEFGVLPKLLMSCNPNKGFTYRDFYKPAREGQLPAYRKYIAALAADNAHLSKAYVENMKRQDPATQERLLFGNWEYDEDPTRLMEYDAIIDLFTNVLKFDEKKKPEKYLTVDVARSGGDRTVFSRWEGWAVREIRWERGLLTDQTAKRAIKMAEDNGIPRSHIGVDEGGVGGGVVDQIKGCKGFLGGASPMKNANYLNLRSEVSYLLAQKVNAREMSIETDDEEVKTAIIAEFEQLKSHDADKDGKVKAIPKEKLMGLLGHSPDFLDCLAIRGMFDLAPRPRITTIGG